ncbi:MAG TPA: TrbI/VirB10 family protein [Xanthobacteraceae bacterium]|jgi:type IV secretion system protein VirB10|nr:TrbI/VirB10 family protein [Xanthobacteraceae bacterium]
MKAAVLSFEKDQSAKASALRPTVRVRGRDNSPFWFAGFAIIMATSLFVGLSNRRDPNIAGRVNGPDSKVPVETVPALNLPDQVYYPPAPPTYSAPVTVTGKQVSPGAAPSPRGMVATAKPIPAPRWIGPPEPTYPPPTISPSADAYVMQGPVTPPPRSITGSDPLTGVSSGERIGARRLARPAMTVPQGTLISAVLETAVNSTVAGQVRAMVTRDVKSFDGTRTLIPRGTKLYGTYGANLEQGQKRAQIRWTRLLRPDAVVVDLDSPASDPLGQGGVGGKVNSHFFARLGNALMSTTLGVGQLLATRRAPIIVTGQGPQAAQLSDRGSNDTRPTLTVRQGSRVSVFVQHDLDFSDVEAE